MSRNFNKETFCSLPWSSATVTPSGGFKVCCLANEDEIRGMAINKDGQVMNIMEHSIMDALNSETHKNHRLQLSQNEWPTRCQNCHEGEKAKNKPDKNGYMQGSARYHRTIEIKEYIPEVISVEQADAKTNIDGTIDNDNFPLELDLQFGNQCNYKCIMCSPHFSNQWYDEWPIVNGTDTQFHKLIKLENGKYTSTIPNWWDHDNFWKEIDRISSHLRLLFILGGEPLIMPQLEKLLDRLIANGHANNIVLDFHTNGSAFNQRLINKMKQFKEIKFKLSLDDTEKRHELIRFPADYTKFIKNAHAFQANGLFFTAFTGCVGLSTIYSPFRIVPLAKEFNVDLNVRFLYTPAEQSLKILPKSAKLEIIKNYVQNSEIVGDVGVAVCNYLKENLEYEDLNLVKKYVKFMDKLDELRGTSWRTTLADVYDLLTRHCPSAFDQ